MTESQRYFARDILQLWESKHGRLDKKLKEEFLFHPMMGAIVTYRWLLIRLAVERSGKKKLQDILKYVEQNSHLTTEEIDSRLKPKGKSRTKKGWELAA